MGRLDTCYAPVRRSPSIKASFDNAAPRLACVKPVASVHPEPGSNSSSLKYHYHWPFIIDHWPFNGNGKLIMENNCLIWKESEPVLLSLSLSDIDGSLFFLYYNFCLCKSFKELAPRAERIRALPVPEVRISLICDCKGTAFLQTDKTINHFFWNHSRIYTLYIIYNTRARTRICKI